MTITEERTTEETVTPAPRLFRTTEWSNGTSHQDTFIYEEVPVELIVSDDRRHVRDDNYVALDVARDYNRNVYTNVNGVRRYYALVGRSNRTEVTRPEVFSLEQLDFDLQEMCRKQGWPFKARGQLYQGVLTKVVVPLLNGKSARSFREVAEGLGIYNEEAVVQGNALTAEIRKQVKGGWAADGKDADTLSFLAAFAHIDTRYHRYIRAAVEAMGKANREFFSEGGLVAAFSHATYEQGHRVNGTSLRPSVTEYLVARFPLATPELPEKFATLDEAGVRAELARLIIAQAEFTDALHQEADQRGMCSEFESIMARVGLPGRPKNYNVEVSVEYTDEISAEDARRTLNLASIEGLPEKLKTKRSNTFTFQHKAGEKPKGTDFDDATIFTRAKAALGLGDGVELTSWTVGNVWH